jgi:SAM-dependent methyltransferase
MPERAYQYHEDVNIGLLKQWGKRKGLRVLDVACGFATTSAEIQKLGNHVTGIDIDPNAVSVAAKRLERAVLADLVNPSDVDAKLGDARFDAIIFADVLEHFSTPIDIMRHYLPRLADGGFVLVSLPNVGLWSVRLALLAGRWNYQDTGVLDRTHLRFFTRRTARELLDDAGLAPVAVRYNPGIARPFVPLAKKLLARNHDGAQQAPDALLKSRPYRLYLNLVHPIERAIASLWPGMLAFQMIFEAKLPGHRGA